MAVCLVTGAAGFLGSQLAERLLADGHEVVGVDAFTRFYDPRRKRRNLEAARSHRRFRLVELDLGAGDLARLPEADRVFHFAAQAGVRPSWGASFAEYAHHNVLATQRLLARYAERPPLRLVYASSSSVYAAADRRPAREDDAPAPRSPYGVTKLAAEELCRVYHRQHGLPAVALRFFTVYGPRQRPDMACHRLLEAALGGQPFEVYGDGRQTRDFTYVDDAVAATVAAAERGRPGAVYNVAGGAGASLLEVAERVAGLAGAAPPMTFAAPAAGDAPHTAADLTLARAELGYDPRTPLAAGLAAQWDWQRAEHAARGAAEGVA